MQDGYHLAFIFNTSIASPPGQCPDGLACLVENTFTSIPDIARILFPFKLIQCLPVWFYKNQFKSHRKSCRITQPTLFLSGLADKVNENLSR